MRTYGQFCPIARASELIAERVDADHRAESAERVPSYAEIRQGRLLLDGPPQLTRAFPTWIRHSPFAGGDAGNRRGPPS